MLRKIFSGQATCGPCLQPELAHSQIGSGIAVDYPDMSKHKPAISTRLIKIIEDWKQSFHLLGAWVPS